MTKNLLAASRWILLLSLPALAIGCGHESVSGGDSAKNASDATAAAEKGGAAAVEYNGPRLPVSSREIAAAVDLRKLPSIEGSKFGMHSAQRLSGSVPGTVKKVVDFYLDAMAKQGYRPSADPNATTVTDGFAQSTLSKEGFLFVLTVTPVGDPKEVGVEIFNQGRFDTQTLPRPDGATLVYGGQANTMLVAPASVTAVAEQLRKSLKAAGWQEYGPVFANQVDTPDQKSINFRQKGYSISAFIAVAPAQQGKTTVQYGVKTLSNELPAPPDAEKIGFDDRRGVLECDVPHDLATTADFYRKAMPETGFTDAPKETPVDKKLYLSFHAANQDIVLVDLATIDEKSTHVKIETFSGELVEKAARAAKEHDKAAEKEKSPSGGK